MLSLKRYGSSVGFFFAIAQLFTLCSETNEEKNYPVVFSIPNDTTIDFVKKVQPRVYAEIGIAVGNTVSQIVKHLPEDSEIHLFDFEDKVKQVANRLRSEGYNNVHSWGNSYKLRDSYNWSLLKVLARNDKPIFDYVFLDGMHTWETDALAFFLIDKLLKPGGYIDFDDYKWTLAGSSTLNPEVFPLTTQLYTEEQIFLQHVTLIVKLLVRTHKNYEEVVEDKIFRKIA